MDMVYYYTFDNKSDPKQTSETGHITFIYFILGYLVAFIDMPLKK